MNQTPQGKASDRQSRHTNPQKKTNRMNRSSLTEESHGIKRFKSGHCQPCMNQPLKLTERNARGVSRNTKPLSTKNPHMGVPNEVNRSIPLSAGETSDEMKISMYDTRVPVIGGEVPNPAGEGQAAEEAGQALPSQHLQRGQYAQAQAQVQEQYQALAQAQHWRRNPYIREEPNPILQQQQQYLHMVQQDNLFVPQNPNPYPQGMKGPSEKAEAPHDTAWQQFTSQEMRCRAAIQQLGIALLQLRQQRNMDRNQINRVTSQLEYYQNELHMSLEVKKRLRPSQPRSKPREKSMERMMQSIAVLKQELQQLLSDKQSLEREIVTTDTLVRTLQLQYGQNRSIETYETYNEYFEQLQMQWARKHEIETLFQLKSNQLRQLRVAEAGSREHERIMNYC